MCLRFLWVADLIQIVYERLTYLSLMQSRKSPCQCWTQPQGMLENGLPEGHLWVRTLSMPCACLVLSQVPDVSRFKLLDKTLNNDSVESQVIWIVNFIKEGEWLIGTSCGNALSLIVHHNNHKHLCETMLMEFIECCEGESCGRLSDGGWKEPCPHELDMLLWCTKTIAIFDTHCMDPTSVNDNH